MYCLIKPCFKMSFRLLSKIKLKQFCAGISIVFILDFFGLFTHIFEIAFDENFVYPYEGDIHEYIVALRHNQKPNLPPINEYNYSFIHDIRDKCIESKVRTLRIVILVKSAIENFQRRIAIRNSWGFEKRFSDVAFKTVFLLGTHFDDELKAQVNLESVKYQDIVQFDSFDSYYNNTIKTMMGFKWAINYCPNSKFYLFVDDDMYLSVKNVLRFIRNPAVYPDYLKEAVKPNIGNIKIKSKRSLTELNTLEQNTSWKYDKKKYSIYEFKKQNLISIKNIKYNTTFSNFILRKKRQIFDFELPDDVRLFTGFVIISAPHRHKSSKWYVSLKEYPYNLWPPYITAGAYILSKEALIDMYYASMYTKHFRFDDIFLGLVAIKADIEPLDCKEFHFYKKDYTKYNYKYVISSHGYGNPEELLRVWNEQKAMGNA